MGKNTSNDIRERIIKHKEAGMTEKRIAASLLINASTVSRIWKLYKETGSYAARPNNCGRKPMVSADTMEKILLKIQEIPDITLMELIEEFTLPISKAALSKRLKKCGLTFKKRHFIQTDKSEVT